ncbi:hypothetical protein Sliba_41000 [Streptomyces nigrescens]|uniref:Uncharacterized protein n=1 Tax=Streptomyces nigrescens TaxID=1920 RepID=A0A640TJ95_STRNI|nr:hypothetical protein Sliba_41000 [Streptomyces libani subsp. libani]GGV93610.1 hypothetical protein GCM10010500_29690 [Streptomyces libani subsp. libani]
MARSTTVSGGSPQPRCADELAVQAVRQQGEVTAVRGKLLPPGREPGETLVDDVKHKRK